MRSPTLLRAVALAGLTSSLAASPAGADFVFYSWTGRVEPALGAGNPWGLLGDGSAVTADGTPYKARALVASDAADLDGSLNPNFARFAPILLLEIGDDIAAVSNVQLSMSDDAFGTLDSISLGTNAELFGTTLSMSMNIRVPIGTYALSDAPAPDLPPVFADTFPVQFGGAGTPDLMTLPDNATVTGRLQTCGDAPIPVSWTSTTNGTAGTSRSRSKGCSRAISAPATSSSRGPTSPRARSARRPSSSSTSSPRTGPRPSRIRSPLS